ncbi:MAG: hypothetical protein ACYCTW_10495, partial [Sulfuricella sp.]
KDKAESAPSGGRSLRCLPLLPCVKPLPRRDCVPENVYADGLMEHPAILGLMLSKDERLYRKYLELADADGEDRFETDIEKRFRIMWQKPIS